MGFFKYPYSSYEKINLDWVLRKIKALEPAIPLVEQSAAIVEEVQETAQEAASAAASAQQAVVTVTALAEQANETAEEAKDIATQAASATIADGSVGWAKLGTDVQQVIEGNVSRSTTATTNAALAQQTANTAHEEAVAAGNTASTAQTTANAAQTTANNVSNAINTKANKLTYAGQLTSGLNIQVPSTAQEVLVVVVDERASLRTIATGTVMLDFSASLQLYINVNGDDTYTVVDSATKRITYDPNMTAPTNTKAWIYYR